MGVTLLRGQPEKLFGSGSGYGDGSGYGYGDGDGDGDGYGDGDGDGDGYGYGDGDGDGDGDGYGDGYGDGDGYGYGYGDGDGSGYGYGSGSGYWEAVLAGVATVAGAVLGFWLSDTNGQPCNGGSGTVARVGLTEEIAGPLVLCGKGALHATLDPTKWKGQRLWIVALHGNVLRDDDKMGALKREFLAEVQWQANS